MAAQPTMLTLQMVFDMLPIRIPNSNKGSYGTVLAVAGSLRYQGAAALCVEGALRIGAGLVHLASVPPVLGPVLARTPECCVHPCAPGPQGCLTAQDASALAAAFAGKRAILLAGPGLGDGAGPVCEALYAGQWGGAVLDADALNALAAAPDASAVLSALATRLPNTVLSPHPGEMARLLGTTTAAVQAGRPTMAVQFARRSGCVLVLKGNGTLIATPEGKLYQNTTGNAGLARGGSGDVLAGMIAGLMAQGLNAETAALCGVWLHGAAADACAARLSMQGMLPHDIFADLCNILMHREAATPQ